MLNIVSKYAKTVLDNVVLPLLEGHIVQTLILQTKIGLENGSKVQARLQSEVTQLQKWMVRVFPSTAAHFVHQQKGTQVEKMGDALEVKLCKPILNYHIVHMR